MNASTAQMIARGRANHNEHVRAGEMGQCCMYCLLVGLTELPVLDRLGDHVVTYAVD